MVSCRSFQPRSLTVVLLASLIIPSNAAITVQLAGNKQPTYTTGSTVDISWTRTDSDPTNFSIGGQGFVPQSVDTGGANSGEVSIKIPEMAPGVYTISAEDPTHSTKYDSLDLSVNQTPGSSEKAESPAKSANVNPSPSPSPPTSDKSTPSQKSSSGPLPPPQTPTLSATSDQTQNPPALTPTPQSGSPGLGTDPSAIPQQGTATNSASLSSSSGLSTGPVIGIVLGVLAIISVMALIGAIVYKRRESAIRSRKHFSFNRDMMVRTTTPASGLVGGHQTDPEARGWETFGSQGGEAYHDDDGAKS